MNHIGKSFDPLNSNANAILDELRIYNRSLGNDEINDLMLL